MAAAGPAEQRKAVGPPSQKTAASKLMRASPDALLGEIEQHGGDQQVEHHKKAHALALVMLGIAGPVKEGDYIARHLIDRGRRTVLVLDRAFAQWRGHRDLMTGEGSII